MCTVTTLAVVKLNVKLGRKYDTRGDLIITGSSRRKISAGAWKLGSDISSPKFLFRGNPEILSFKFVLTFSFLLMEEHQCRIFMYFSKYY
jgi:hypothetical protein